MDFVSERLRFRHLLLVQALASFGSLRKAGHALGISQSSATKLLSELERGVTARLFTRSALGVTPTEQGAAYIRAANMMLAESDAARDELAALERGTVGKVRVGVFAIAASPIISQAVVTLQASNPQISTRIEDGTGAALLSALQHGNLDCAIGRAGSEIDPELPRHPMRSERVALIVRRGHPLARKARIALRDVVRARWILPTREAIHRQPLEIALAAHGLPLPEHTVESSAFVFNQTLVQQTDAVVPLPYSLTTMLRGHKELFVLPVSLSVPMQPIVLWTRQQEPYSPPVRKFITAAANAAPRYLGSPLLISPLRSARIIARYQELITRA